MYLAMHLKLGRTDGNQLTVRDLNKVGADMVYDSLDELLTSGGQSVTTDVKRNQTVLAAFDRKSSREKSI